MSKKKFKRGEQITSVAEFMEHDWFIVNGKTFHKCWVSSWSLRLAQLYIDRGVAYIAKRLTNGEYYPNMSVNEIQERLDEGLCDYCPLPEEVHGMHLGPNGPYGCEGSHCEEAAEAWKEELVE